MSNRDSKVKDCRIEGANEYRQRVETAERITGVVTPRHIILGTAWLNGFEAGVEAAGRGELLEECTTLHHQMFDLDSTEHEHLAMSELIDAVRCETCMHTDDCECALCKAFAAYEERRSEIQETGK
jgi:hypothetical protein